MRVTIAAAAAAFALAGSASGAEGEAPCTHGFVCELLGSYQASGTAFGKPAALTMRWSVDLGGAFVRIDYRIDGSAAERATTFAGIGHYKMEASGRFTGVWVDSQGAIHPLEASAAGRALTTYWGVRGKGAYGRTTYRMLDADRIEVVDAVLAKDSTWREFSRNTLIRTGEQ